MTYVFCLKVKNDKANKNIPKGKMPMQNNTKIRATLGSSSFLIINKKIAKYVGLNSALLLSHLISKDEYFASNNTDYQGWFYNTRDRIEDDIFLTPHEQRTALQKLIEVNFLQVKKQGMPCKSWYSLNYQQIADFLHQDCENLITSSQETANKLSKNLTSSCEKFEHQVVKNFDDMYTKSNSILNQNLNQTEIHAEQSSSSVSLQKENNILIPDNTPTNTNQKKRTLKNYTADFDKFWQLYKGVGSKSKAFEYWQKIKKTIDIERIYQAVEIYNQELTEEKYRKHAEGWLNQRLDTYLEKIDNPNLISLSEERAVKEQRIVEEEHERLRLQYVREEKAERYRLYELKDPNYAKWQMPYTMYEYLQKHGASKAVLQYHKNLQINREAV